MRTTKPGLHQSDADPKNAALNNTGVSIVRCRVSGARVRLTYLGACP